MILIEKIKGVNLLINETPYFHYEVLMYAFCTAEKIWTVHLKIGGP